LIKKLVVINILTPNPEKYLLYLDLTFWFEYEPMYF